MELWNIKWEICFKVTLSHCSSAMRTLYFLLFMMVFLGSTASTEASERTKNTFWTKRSTSWTKRFDTEAKNQLEKPSKLANLGGQFQDLLTSMQKRKYPREMVQCLEIIPPNMSYLFSGFWCVCV